jgi:hypothetical protein
VTVLIAFSLVAVIASIFTTKRSARR